MKVDKELWAKCRIQAAIELNLNMEQLAILGFTIKFIPKENIKDGGWIVYESNKG